MAPAVVRTLRTAVVCTLSPEVNLVEGGIGAATMVTKTVALWFAVPPAPEQEMVYVVVCVGEKDCVPDVAFVPLHPPDAVQDVAFVELHVRVEDWLDVIDEGEAEKERVGEEGGGGGGGGGGVTVWLDVGTGMIKVSMRPFRSSIFEPNMTSFPSGLSVACGCAQ